MSELSKMFEQDAQTASLPTVNELDELNRLVELQLSLEREQTELEERLKEVGEKLRGVQEAAIPELMASVGITGFKLNSGFVVSIKSDVFASIRAEHVGSAVKWLDNNGLGDIVKDEVKIAFGRGEALKAHDVMEFCRLNKYPAIEKMSVHPSTLKAVVKEQLARGVEFPEEYFSIAPIRKSIIKLK